MIRWLLWEVPRYRVLHYVIYLYLGLVLLPSLFGVTYSVTTLVLYFIVMDLWYYIRTNAGSR